MMSPSLILRCPSSEELYVSTQTTVLPGRDMLPIVVSEFAVPTPLLSLMISLASPMLLSATPSASTEKTHEFQQQSLKKSTLDCCL